MQLDRSKQLALLQAMANVYPRHATELFGGGEPTEADFANLWYLKEQGLVEGSLGMTITGAFYLDGTKITARGLDFLADDGGISAILGTVTVRLHADSIKDLLLARVESSSAPARKKSWLKRQLDTASNETIKKIVGTILDEGVKHAPDVLRLIDQAVKGAP
jgi:hypothetical protein